MKKTISIIALFIVLLVNVSAGSSISQTAVEGLPVPHLEFTALDSHTVDLAAPRTEYTIVHLWSANDAQSRIKAIQLDRLVTASNGRIHLMSINTDSNERLFREIVRIDEMDETTQYYAGSAASSRFIRECGQNRGLQSLIIAPDGTIAAVNPSDNALANL